MVPRTKKPWNLRIWTLDLSQKIGKCMLVMSGQSRVFTRADSTPLKWALGACCWRCICILDTFFYLIYIYTFCYQCWYHIMQLYYSDFRWEIWASILGAPIALSYLYTVDSLKSQCGVRVDLSHPSKFDPYFQCIQTRSGQAVSEVHVLQTWKHWGAALQWSSDKAPWLPKIRWSYQDW